MEPAAALDRGPVGGAGCSLLLLIPATRPVGAIASALLLTAFTAVQARAVIRKLEVGCGCFGGGSERVSWLQVGRNAVLIALATGAAVAPH